MEVKYTKVKTSSGCLEVLGEEKGNFFKARKKE